MKTALKLEEFALFLIGVIGFIHFGGTEIQFLVFILAPDLSMVGYLRNPKTGAFIYNIVHHKATGIILFILGLMTSNQLLILSGIILFSHSSMDRSLGYGLKYNESFNNTHLGKIGKNK